jgi:hypothetical protein
MCQAHQGRDSPPPDSAKIRCQKVGKSEMGKILVLGPRVLDAGLVLGRCSSVLLVLESAQSWSWGNRWRPEPP